MKSSSAVGVLALLPTLALGQSLRCGEKIINEGTSQVEVAALCGQPTLVQHLPAYDGVVAGEAVVSSEVQIEIWTYNFGPNKLMERIRFENGIVTKIDSLGYGY